MFKDIFELDKPVVDRISARVLDDSLPIELEIGIVKNGMVKVLFIYNDRAQLDQIIANAIKEEYELP